MSAFLADPDFIHRFIPAAEKGLTPLLLLHGTGGNEDDLLPIAPMIGGGRAVLSPRGKVLEGGMPRFFRRLSEGVFDEADVVRRAVELADFIAASRERHGMAAPIAFGFSNGANIAAAMLLLRPEALAGAILVRAMTPLYNTVANGALNGKPVMILSGAMDPIVPAANAQNLVSLLQKQGASVTHHILPAGHGLGRMDIDLAKGFLEALR